MEVKSLNLKSLTPNDLNLFRKTILENPYVRFKPYPKQAWPIFILNKPYFPFVKDGEIVQKPNSCLVGAGGYGGKTYLGAMLAAQYLQNKNYKCLVTRLNYDDLIDEDSIFGYLSEWCGPGSGLPDDLICKVDHSKLKIKSPAGAVLTFRAFNHAKKKSKIRSKSYHRIVNDESSEGVKQVLSFQPRSLRRDKRTKIPLSICDLSNPSENEETNDYLIEKYIDGQYPYIALDWRDNPHITQEEYSATLDDLDYIDQQYQKYGNWKYKPKKGDLFALSVLESIIRNKGKKYDTETDYIKWILNKSEYNLMAVDLASTGSDTTGISNHAYIGNRRQMLLDLMEDPSANPEVMIYDFLEKWNPEEEELVTDELIFEKEPGSDFEYSLRYWEKELSDFVDRGLEIDIVNVEKSKYQRARPLSRHINRGRFFIHTDIKQRYRLGERLNKIWILKKFFDELIQLDPQGKGKSPNLVDAVTLGTNYLDNEDNWKRSVVSVV